jgi:hypothetical protein
MGDRQDPKGWCASHGRESRPRRRSGPSDEIPSMPSLRRRRSRQRHLQLRRSTASRRTDTDTRRQCAIVFFRPCGFPGAPTPTRPPATSREETKARGPSDAMRDRGGEADPGLKVNPSAVSPRRDRPNREVELRYPGPLNVSARTRQNNPISGRLP